MAFIRSSHFILKYARMSDYENWLSLYCLSLDLLNSHFFPVSEDSPNTNFYWCGPTGSSFWFISLLPSRAPVQSPWTTENFTSYPRHFPYPYSFRIKASWGVSVPAPGHIPLFSFVLYFVCPVCPGYSVNSKHHLGPDKYSPWHYDDHKGMQQQQQVECWKHHHMSTLHRVTHTPLFY